MLQYMTGTVTKMNLKDAFLIKISLLIYFKTKTKRRKKSRIYSDTAIQYKYVKRKYLQHKFVLLHFVRPEDFSFLS